jgi:YidC/Oxa1 family membrane protein insertase
MDNRRLLPWLAVAILLWINYTTWQQDHPPAPPPAAPPGTAAPAAGPAVDDVPRAPATPRAAGAPGETGNAPVAPVLPETVPAAGAASTAPLVHISTDVLDLDISTEGGTLVRADLPAYPVSKQDPSQVVRLLASTPADERFVLESGLVAAEGAAPDHRALYRASAESYHLAADANELLVPLSWSEGPVTVTKTYTFRRGSYAIGVRYLVKNSGSEPVKAASYAQLLRHFQKVERSYFNPDTYAYRGPAIWTGEKYKKLDVEKKDPDALPKRPVAGGWAAALQHHFVAAIVPPAATPSTYTLSYANGDYLLRELGETMTVAPGETREIGLDLFVGPKLQSQLEVLSPELGRAADYGWLFIIARPLFLLLAFVHRFVHNWGFTIILVTFLIKLAFYKLAETSGRSMAKMRNLAPRMKDIQERYKDDREELGRQMMELYKREKINPLGGCLPTIVQIPVFIAFYWVLLESVEMRQAPWILWVQDLSSRDSTFVLPAIMAGAMFAQFKLNPPPPDPVQAKVFAFMPFVMAATMAFFPSGLVLYWITNTALSVLQQWRINKVVTNEAAKPRR